MRLSSHWGLLTLLAAVITGYLVGSAGNPASSSVDSGTGADCLSPSRRVVRSHQSRSTKALFDRSIRPGMGQSARPISGEPLAAGIGTDFVPGTIQPECRDNAIEARNDNRRAMRHYSSSWVKPVLFSPLLHVLPFSG
jgi:hypothetical protein